MPNSAKCSDIRQLHDRIETLDAITQEYCAGIVAVAHMALNSMQTSNFWNDPKSIEMAFDLIRVRADELMNTINHEAEKVGCNWVDNRGNERMVAYYESIRTEASHG
jgi:hypothetical protein